MRQSLLTGGQHGTSRDVATTEDLPPLMRPVDVAELLNVSRKTAYRLIERGELDAIHVGRSVRVRPDDLTAYLERGGHR
jgi:excisionase family DNA binding protein